MLDVNPNAYWENHIDMLVGLTLPMQRFAGLLLADVQSAADAHWQLARAYNRFLAASLRSALSGGDPRQSLQAADELLARAAASTQAASALTRTALAIAGQLAR